MATFAVGKKPQLTPLFLILLLTSPACLGAYLNAEKSVHVINVGYGLAIHVKSETGNYLIDTGPKEAESILIDHLVKEGVARVDAVFLTHTHPDHAGNLLALLKRWPVERIYWNDLLPPDEAAAAELENAFKWTSVTVLKPGDQVRLEEDLILTVLKSNVDSQDLNDRSLVYGLQWGKSKLLFLSDGSPATQKDLAIQNKPWIKNIKFLLWPHHGGPMDPDLAALLKHTKTCVASVGPNDHGMPVAELDREAKPVCQTLLRTDQDGDPSFSAIIWHP